MADQPRELVTISRYSDLHAIMRERAVAIGISREVLDSVSGVTDGLSSKILSPKPMRKMGDLSLSCILPALGMRLVAMEDPEALKRTFAHSDYKKRDETAAKHARTVSVIFSMRHLRSIARRGGKNSRRYMTRERASEIARKAGENSRAYMTRERATELARKAGKAGAKARWGSA